MSQQLTLDETRSVVILRALQLGDLLCSLPALRSLRGRLPDAHIALIGLPWARELVDRIDSVDELIEFPGFPGMPEVEADASVLPAFFDRMQARRFDLALQMHGSGLVSNAFVSMLGARHSAGFGVPGVPNGLDHVVAYPTGRSEVRRQLTLMRSLGLVTDDERLALPLTDVDHAALRALPEAAQLRPGTFACLHPGARDRRRRWALERFATVGDALAAEGLQVVLTGVADDASLTAMVAAQMRRPAIDLAGRTSLGALLALLAGARLLVANDTGVSHLADALGVPSVIVFSGSDPGRWAPHDGTLHRAVGGPRSQAGGVCCLGEACPDAGVLWRPVGPAEVVLAARELLHVSRQHAA
ncbi:MAG TPA: glycosyltransferase family 9 protein [Candidatus Limnocylindria bacterium]|nr:glycosyltransferase family 9 protein [Candidatus Limnocylindria bacterium]